MPKQKKVFLPSPEIIAEAVNPDAAIEFWKQRAKLTDEEAKALGEEAKYRAFYVTGLAQHDLVQMVSDGIEEALKNGETLSDFKKRILGAIQSQGWHGSRVENIFRTNVQTAYAAGRYTKMQAVKKIRPYWQYIAIMDSRVRPSHAVMNGKVYPADHAFWNNNYPPNGFRCRCGVRSLSARQVKDMGLKVETELPKTGGADKGFQNNPGKHWAETGLDLKKYGLQNTAPPKPKKEPVTQKKLISDISTLEKLISTSKNTKEIEILNKEKANLEKELEEKKLKSDKNKLNKELKLISNKIENYDIKTYKYIWYDDVTIYNFQEIKKDLEKSKTYLSGKLSSDSLSEEKKNNIKNQLQDIDKFVADASEYQKLLDKKEKIQKALSSLAEAAKKQKASSTPTANQGAKHVFQPSADAYSEERKRNALWARHPQEADDVLRNKCGEVWRSATDQQKKAIFDYTVNPDPFNRPLRKIDKMTDEKAANIRQMESIIDQSSYDRDIKLQRGISTDAGAEAFFQLPRGALYSWSLEELRKALVGQRRTELGFASCGSSQGKGFSGYILYIYCPKGTKMMYAEPFSNYGGVKRGLSWDGIAKQDKYGIEDETIIQRGTTFRITGVNRDPNGKPSFELEVVEQI